MIPRLLKPTLENRLKQFPAVALFGPRQSGKTTLAIELAKERKDRAVYLDLENPADRRRLDDPVAYFQSQRGRLVVLDEIHRVPEIFSVLRSEIDAGQARNRANFLYSVPPRSIFYGSRPKASPVGSTSSN